MVIRSYYVIKLIIKKKVKLFWPEIILTGYTRVVILWCVLMLENILKIPKNILNIP